MNFTCIHKSSAQNKRMVGPKLPWGSKPEKKHGCDIHQCVEVIPYAINEDKNYGSFILLNITQMPFCENILKGRH